MKVSYWEEVPEVRRILQCPRERPQLSALGMRVVVGRWPQRPWGRHLEDACQLKGPAGGEGPLAGGSQSPAGQSLGHSQWGAEAGGAQR